MRLDLSAASLIAMISSMLSAQLFTIPAFAKSEPVSRARLTSDAYNIHAELYFDKEKKKVDLWIEYEQGKIPSERIAFKATSLPDRTKEADWQLTPAPAALVEGETVQIFDAFNAATKQFNVNRAFSLIFHVPVEALNEKTLELFESAFPNSVVRDSYGEPKFIKSVLCRITEFQIYPIAAFDVELDLLTSR